MLSLYTAWFLYLNPRHIHLFLVTIGIAIGFVVAMALLPKYRQRLVKGALEYDAKGKERGGWVYRYQKVATALILISALTLPIIWIYQLIPSSYMSWFALSLIIVISVSGSILIAGLLRAAGKWGLLLLSIIFVVAFLRILVWSR
jgi:hypothetical protein